MQVLRINEQMLPGDVLGVSPRHPPVTQPIKERMAQIIRERSLDLVNLMDDFLKRPTYSRMPTRNRAFLQVPDFRRAICYAFGDQWTRLAMTTAEVRNLRPPTTPLPALLMCSAHTSHLQHRLSADFALRAPFALPSRARAVPADHRRVRADGRRLNVAVRARPGPGSA